jgi:hypothetical protein
MPVVISCLWSFPSVVISACGRFFPVMLSETGPFAGELAGEVEAPLPSFASFLPFQGVPTQVGCA